MNKLFTGIAGLTVLLLHTAAQAQQVAPPPQEYPPAYAPPPGYVPPPPPPPAYGEPTYGPPPTYGAAPVYVPPPPYRYAPAYRYAPPSYYALPPPPPPRDVLYRPLTLGFGIGFGGLIFDDNMGNHTHQGGFAYTGRIGFGLRPGLILLLDTEGAVVGDGATTISQSANVIGLQIFVTRRLFVKGGFGFGAASQDNAPTLWGPAAMGGAGYELAQGWNWSFDIEATISGARYHDNGVDQSWTNWSLVNFALNFF